MWQDFRAFAFKGNVVDLAVGVVIGAAFTAIVKAIVDGLVMPVVGAITPGSNWQTWHLWKLEVGLVLAAILNFLIVAMVLFLVVAKLMKAFAKKKAPEPTPSEVLLTDIRDLLAKRA